MTVAQTDFWLRSRKHAPHCDHHVYNALYTMHCIQYTHEPTHTVSNIWQSNGLVLVQDIARYLATVAFHCMHYTHEPSNDSGHFHNNVII